LVISAPELTWQSIINIMNIVASFSRLPTHLKVLSILFISAASVALISLIVFAIQEQRASQSGPDNEIPGKKPPENKTAHAELTGKIEALYSALSPLDSAQLDDLENLLTSLKSCDLTGNHTKYWTKYYAIFDKSMTDLEKCKAENKLDLAKVDELEARIAKSTNLSEKEKNSLMARIEILLTNSESEISSVDDPGSSDDSKESSSSSFESQKNDKNSNEPVDQPSELTQEDPNVNLKSETEPPARTTELNLEPPISSSLPLKTVKNSTVSAPTANSNLANASEQSKKAASNNRIKAERRDHPVKSPRHSQRSLKSDNIPSLKTGKKQSLKKKKPKKSSHQGSKSTSKPLIPKIQFVSTQTIPEVQTIDVITISEVKPFNYDDTIPVIPSESPNPDLNGQLDQPNGNLKEEPKDPTTMSTDTSSLKSETKKPMWDVKAKIARRSQTFKSKPKFIKSSKRPSKTDDKSPKDQSNDLIEDLKDQNRDNAGKINLLQVKNKAGPNDDGVKNLPNNDDITGIDIKDTSNFDRITDLNENDLKEPNLTNLDNTIDPLDSLVKTDSIDDGNKTDLSKNDSNTIINNSKPNTPNVDTKAIADPSSLLFTLNSDIQPVDSIKNSVQDTSSINPNSGSNTLSINSDLPNDLKKNLDLNISDKEKKSEDSSAISPPLSMNGDVDSSNLKSDSNNLENITAIGEPAKNIPPPLNDGLSGNVDNTLNNATSSTSSNSLIDSTVSPLDSETPENTIPSQNSNLPVWDRSYIDRDIKKITKEMKAFPEINSLEDCLLHYCKDRSSLKNMVKHYMNLVLKSEAEKLKEKKSNGWFIGPSNTSSPTPRHSRRLSTPESVSDQLTSLFIKETTNDSENDSKLESILARSYLHFNGEYQLSKDPSGKCILHKSKELPDVFNNSDIIKAALENIRDELEKRFGERLDETPQFIKSPHVGGNVFREGFELMEKQILNYMVRTPKYASLRRGFELAKIDAIIMKDLDTVKDSNNIPRMKEFLVKYGDELRELARFDVKFSDDDYFEIHSGEEVVTLPAPRFIFALFNSLHPDLDANDEKNVNLRFYLEQTWPNIRKELPRLYGLLLVRDRLLFRPNYFLSSVFSGLDLETTYKEFLLHSSYVAFQNSIVFFNSFLQRNKDDKIVTQKEETKLIKPNEGTEYLQRNVKYHIIPSWTFFPTLYSWTSFAVSNYLLNLTESTITGCICELVPLSEEEIRKFNELPIGAEYIFPDREFTQKTKEEGETRGENLISLSAHLAFSEEVAKKIM
jgi:hypothetical protein